MGIEDIVSSIISVLVFVFLNKYEGQSGGISLLLCFCSFVERRNFCTANNSFLSATYFLLLLSLSSPSFLQLLQNFTHSAVILIFTQKGEDHLGRYYSLV